jgi:hypothetical protein
MWFGHVGAQSKVEIYVAWRDGCSAGILGSACPFCTGPAGPAGGQHPESPGPSSATAAAAAAAAAVKTRLRWTPELHEKFVTAVSQLGGADRKFSITSR